MSEKPYIESERDRTLRALIHTEDTIKSLNNITSHGFYALPVGDLNKIIEFCRWLDEDIKQKLLHAMKASEADDNE